VIDRPRLFGWSSLHPAHRQSLTPLCRRSGTVSSVPGPTAGWLDALSCDEAPRVDPRDRDRHPAPPCGAAGAPIGTPSTVSRSTGVASGRRALRATWFGSVARLAHRSRFEAAAVCVSTPSESPSASAAPSIRLAVPRASRRAMRRTSFCHLTSSYEHPYLVGFRAVERLRALLRRSRLLHGRTSRFGGSHVAPLRDFTAAGVVFPLRRVRAVPLTPLSPPVLSPWSSRSLRSRTGRRDRLDPPA
jgi:hypothetical protein